MVYTKLDEEDKAKLLALLQFPRKIYFIMSKMDWGYSKTYHILNILEVEEEVKKIKTSSGGIVYKV